MLLKGTSLPTIIGSLSVVSQITVILLCPSTRIIQSGLSRVKHQTNLSSEFLKKIRSSSVITASITLSFNQQMSLNLLVVVTELVYPVLPMVVKRFHISTLGKPYLLYCLLQAQQYKEDSYWTPKNHLALLVNSILEALICT
jgi:hypothetical protein